MESHGQLDPACPAPARRPLIRFVAALVLLSCMVLPCNGQSPTQQSDEISVVEQLFNQQQWAEIVRIVQALPAPPSAELDYYSGMALARLGLWNRASQALMAGRRLQPGDERFPVELAGVAFKQ